MSNKLIIGIIVCLHHAVGSVSAQHNDDLCDIYSRALQDKSLSKIDSIIAAEANNM